MGHAEHSFTPLSRSNKLKQMLLAPETALTIHEKVRNLAMTENEIRSYANYYEINITKPYTVTVSELPMCDVEECRDDATYSLTIDTRRDIYNLWHSCSSDLREALRQAQYSADDDEIVLEKMVAA